MANNIDIIINTIDRTAPGFMSIMQTVGDVYEGVKKIVDETVQFGDDVNELSRLTGQSLEESSRLISAAEGMGVSYKELATGLGNATKRGVDTSIENILLLADEYAKLNDPITGPIDRARWLTDNFGAAGTSLAPLFEASAARIVTAMGSVEPGLIWDEEKQAATEQYKTSVKEMTDSWDALKLKLGTVIIPLLTEVLNLMNSIAAGKNVPGAAADFLNGLFEGTALEGNRPQGISENETLAGYFSGLEGAMGAVVTGAGNVASAINESATTSVGKLEEVASAIDSLEDKTVTITVVTQEQNSYGEGGYIGYLENQAGVDMNGNGIIGMATGGYAAGGPFLVGERGPELFTPSGGGQITPNNQLGGGGMSQSQMTQFAQIMSVALAAEVQKLTG